MRGALYLAVMRLRANLLASGILMFCFAFTAGLPMAASLLLSRYEASLHARATDTPLIAGARGSRFDLVLSTTHFRRAQVPPTRYAVVDRINAMRLGIAIPMHTQFSARGHPVVGTSPEYRDLREFRFAAGEWPLQLGEAVLGAEVARRESFGVGDTIYSDQPDTFDISQPPAIRLHIAGVLEETGSADDHAVFVDIATAWMLSGIVHGHENPREVRDPRVILQRSDAHVAVSGAMIEYNEVTPDSADSYHLHANPGELPLSGIIVVPKDAKSATIVSTEVNLMPDCQMVVPTRVIDELLSYVLRIKSLVDGIAMVLVAVNVLLTGLIIAFSVRARERERLTMHRIGCDRFFVPLTFACEFGCIFLLGVLLAAIAAGGLSLVAPDIIAWL
jgi:putative ABC transport system permease protein